MSFDRFIERVLSSEGGYVNHPKDPGAETKWGISKRSYPHLNIKELTREQAKEIYRRDFWDRIDGNKLHEDVAFQVLDAAVNHGRGNAIRWLQRAAGCADDGVLGPISHAAIARVPAIDLVLRFNAERLEFYTKLSTWSTFGKGWARRIAENLRYAAEDIDD